MSGGSPVPALCGVNNHQHLIYSVTPDSGPSQLSIILSVSTVTMAQSSNARLWNIRIYQAGTRTKTVKLYLLWMVYLCC